MVTIKLEKKNRLSNLYLYIFQKNPEKFMRIGHGYDAHRLTKGTTITLGGVKIDNNFSLLAHSDGDVLIHAICDSLLGACALGDIGVYFPDTDSNISNIDSRRILRKVVALVHNEGWRIGNIDATIIAQRPKILPYALMMRTLIAKDTLIDINQISIKGTTTERLGFTGREEGISAHSITLLLPL